MTEVVAMPTYMEQWWFKDGISEFCAQSELLAGVVTHVLHDRWGGVKDNGFKLQEITHGEQSTPDPQYTD